MLLSALTREVVRIPHDGAHGQAVGAPPGAVTARMPAVLIAERLLVCFEELAIRLSQLLAGYGDDIVDEIKI